MKRMIGLTAMLALAGIGCGDDDGDDTTLELDMGTDADTPEGDGGVDLGVDAGPDMGGSSCGIGTACTEVRGCATVGAECLEFTIPPQGGPSDPITDHPDGEDSTYQATFFAGGYCTTSFPGLPTECVPDTDEGEEFCGDCATCVDLFGDGGGTCLASCEPSVTDNGSCRDGYECNLSGEFCLDGCTSDASCRISRVEGNGIPGLQTAAECSETPAACTPADCGDETPADPAACATPSGNFDRLVYDTTSEAVCDPDTFRCVGAPSNPTAAGGDTCTTDTDCEAEGFCIEEDPDDGSWPGGYCIKLRCDLPGNECANGGKCQESGLGVFACTEGCTVGGFDTTSDPSTWSADGAAQDTCRDGYGCFWDGAGAGGVANNGACLPVEYNPEVTAPNTGDECEADSDCFSPFGVGRCLRNTSFPNGYCTVSNCGAPWFTEGTPADANVCGDSGFCVSFDEEDPTFALCLETCTTADTCAAGLGCVDITATTKGCFPGCSADADCRTGERCSMAGTANAECVPE